MKQLTCEVCGGKNILKEDGVFVCQDCGCKYSLTEVQGLLKEKNEELEDFTMGQRYYILGLKALDHQDWQEVVKYFNLFIEKVPEDPVAYFYRAYANAHLSLLEQNMLKRINAFEVLKNCLFTFDYYFLLSEGNQEFITDLTEYLIELAQSPYGYSDITVDDDNGGRRIAWTNQAKAKDLFNMILSVHENNIFAAIDEYNLIKKNDSSFSLEEEDLKFREEDRNEVHWLFKILLLISQFKRDFLYQQSRVGLLDFEIEQEKQRIEELEIITSRLIKIIRNLDLELIPIENYKSLWSDKI